MLYSCTCMATVSVKSSTLTDFQSTLNSFCRIVYSVRSKFSIWLNTFQFEMRFDPRQLSYADCYLLTIESRFDLLDVGQLIYQRMEGSLCASLGPVSLSLIISVS